MHKNISRIFAALACLAVIPAVAFASSSRIQGMNVPGDYVKDYTGIFTYVSGIGSVGNLVYVEPGNFTTDNGMGAVLGNLWEGRLGTWGVNLRQFSPTLGQAFSADPLTTSLGASDPNSNGEAFDLMWGHKMGTGSLGLRLNRSFISREVTAGTAEGNGSNGRNVWGLGAGFGFAMNSNTDVEVSALFQNRSFKGTNLTSPDAAADDGGSTYMISARAMKKASGNLTLTPVVKYYKFDLSAQDVAAVSTDESMSGWQFGLAGNWALASDDLFVLGAQFVGNKHETTVGTGPTNTDTETYYPNVFMALETHTNSWLTLRFGAQNAMMYSAKNESGAPAVTTTNKRHAFSYQIGATVKAGSMAFDAVLAPNFYNNPVAGTFNSGAGVGVPFSRVSATYSF